MTPGDFEDKNAARWAEYEALLAAAAKRNPEDPRVRELPRRFREMCLDLSLAENRMYGVRITEKLNALVIRGYERLYRARRGGLERFARFVTVGFPQAVRKDWKLFWLCNGAFWLPFILMMISESHDLRWIQAVLGAEGMANMESMYGSQEDQISHLRSEYGSNFMMFCFYIYNNVAIDFRIFAGGMLAGLGTLFFLLFNGVYLGAAAGYVNHACDPVSFWSFVSGHSSFELIGMVIAGMAGMRIGLAILNPGRLPRSRALTAAARESLPLLYGAALLTTLAAVVEGFWSAQPLDPMLKYIVGIVGWVAHALYFIFAGRGREEVAI
jgi:uncharacterized membrane protein SpoIIM required for sporulation